MGKSRFVFLLATILMTLSTQVSAQSSSAFYAPMEGAVNQLESIDFDDQGHPFIMGGYRVFIDSIENVVAAAPVLWSFDNELSQVACFKDRFAFGYPNSKSFAISGQSLLLHQKLFVSGFDSVSISELDQAGGTLYSGGTYFNAGGVNGIEVFDDRYFLLTERYIDTDSTKAVVEAWSTSHELQWIAHFDGGITRNQISDLQPYGAEEIIFLLHEQDGTTGPQLDQRHFLVTLNTSTGAVTQKVDVTPYRPRSVFLQSTAFTVADNGDILWMQDVVETDLYSQGALVRRTFPDLALVWEAVLPSDAVRNNRKYAITDAKIASNGDVLICGEVSQCPDRNSPQQGEICFGRGFVARYTPDGELIWNRTFSTPNELLPIEVAGRYVRSFLREIYEQADGSIFTAGTALYSDQVSFLNHPDSTDSWYIILELDGETGCLAGEECVEDIVLDGQVVDTTGLIFPIGTQWTYEYRELESLRIVHSTVTFEVVDTLDYRGRAASQVVSTLGDTIYLSEEGMSVYVYDDRIQDYVLTFDFDANNRYSDSITYFRPYEEDFARAEVRVDSLGQVYTGEDRGFEIGQFLEVTYRTNSPFLDTSVFTYRFGVVELIGRLYGGGTITSPFHWPTAPFTIDDNDVPFPAYGALRCFSSGGVEIDFLPIWPEEPCDTTFFEYIYPWSLDQIDPDRTWYVLQEDLSSDRLTTRSYGLSRDTFLLDGNYYHLMLQSDVEDQAPATPTSFYLRQEGGAVYRYTEGSEQLIYDYNHRPGDVIDASHLEGADELICIGVDTTFTLFTGSPIMRRQLHYAPIIDGEQSPDTCMTVLSGIGTLEGIEFGNPILCGRELQLNCMLEASRIRYHYQRFGDQDDCWIVRTNTDELANETSGIRVYPNPVGDQLSIVSKAVIDEVSMYTVDGRQVYRAARVGKRQHNFAVQDLEVGVYMIVVQDDSGISETQKVVIYR